MVLQQDPGGPQGVSRSQLGLGMGRPGSSAGGRDPCRTAYEWHTDSAY